jgi:transglutaminase-like putative cysteine protease
MQDDAAQYLAPTYFVDSDHPDVVAFAERAAGDVTDARARAVRLFRAVRDGFRYDPYRVSRDPADYRASAIVHTKRAFCIPKAVVLVAAARALGIPARLRFSDVKNHLSSERLRARMGTDLFVYHGTADLFLDGRWVKASPAFDRDLCEHFGVPPLDFDGMQDALFSAYDAEGREQMVYVRDHGSFADLPFDEIARAFVATYGDDPPSDAP